VLDADAAKTLREMAARGVPKVDIAQTLGISRASVYEYLKA
jgi:predicted transcriptional regulator